jgi:hypothetical protein
MNYVEQLAEDIYVAVHNRPMPESHRLLYLFDAGLALAVGTSATAEQALIPGALGRVHSRPTIRT